MRDAGHSEHLSIVIVGHVDHGKSTLLGRLYADTGSLPEGKLEKVQAICRQQGKEFEYAFLFDAFLEEQEQGITIDTARTFFAWKDRQYVIIDAPGHKEFLKNMVSGAARAEAALLVIDAAEGVQEQSRRHGQLLSLLGIRQVAIVVNKMDLVDYRQDVYDAIEREYRGFLAELRVEPERFVPASARHGDNVAVESEHMPWYHGRTVLDTLALFRKQSPQDAMPLRFPVQDVYKFDARRIIAGRVAAGRLMVGDRLLFSPSNKSAVVRTVEGFNLDPLPLEAEAGQSIGVTLDEQIFIERGEIASHIETPPQVATLIRCNLFWLGNRPLQIGHRYLMRLATREVSCEIATIHRALNAEDLASRQALSQVERNQVAEVTIRTRAPIAIDLYSDFEVTGRFVLVDGYDVAGGGIATEAVPDEHASLRAEARRRELSWIKGEVGLEERAEQLGHRAALVLIAGSTAASSRALACRLESRLVLDGRHSYLFDSANLQRGLDADMVRANVVESLRRYGEVARLLLDTGLIVVSTITPSDDYEAIPDLVNPVPVFVIQLAGVDDPPLPSADLTIAATTGIEGSVDLVLDHLRKEAILAEPIGEKTHFQYANYAI